MNERSLTDEKTRVPLTSGPVARQEERRDELANHPNHYGGKDNPYEVIKVLEQWLTPTEYFGFLKGNQLKYLARHRAKGGRKDLEKASVYGRFIDEFLVRNAEMKF